MKVKLLFVFCLVHLILLTSCNSEQEDFNQRLVVGQWACDSIISNDVLYIPENSPLLFFYEKQRKLIEYKPNGELLVTGHKLEASYLIRNSQLFVIQEFWNDTIIKDILRLSEHSMILEQKALVTNYVVHRGDFYSQNKITLYYSKK
jgi:hypothetical protein